MTRTVTADPAPAAIDPRAQEHLTAAEQLFASHDYAGVIRELEIAYGIDPRPTMIYAMAQAERLRGDCKRAIELYDKFLATDPPRLQRDPAVENRELCAHVIELDRPPATPPPPPPTPPPAVVSHPPAPTPGHGQPAQWWSIGFAAAGVVSGGVALWLWHDVGQLQDRANRLVGPLDPDGQALLAQGSHRQDEAIVAAVVTGALVTTGAVLWILGAVEARREHEVVVAPIATPTTAGITARWRF